jgi:hypothetical protein
LDASLFQPKSKQALRSQHQCRSMLQSARLGFLPKTHRHRLLLPSRSPETRIQVCRCGCHSTSISLHHHQGSAIMLTLECLVCGQVSDKRSSGFPLLLDQMSSEHRLPFCYYRVFASSSQLCWLFQPKHQPFFWCPLSLHLTLVLAALF